MLKNFKTNIFLLFFIMTAFFARSNEVTLQYIEKYKTIAISEMERVGIPASIKLAQGILESNSGLSNLARQSNNHFGIKCGNRWNGKEVYRHDDDYENGLLVRSCFRAYDDPFDSFIAHSNFLSNPHSRRYKFLFTLDNKDYKGWAFGLKDSGYATDKNYPKKLIEIIERYQLFQYDDQLYININEEPLLADNDQYVDDRKHEVLDRRKTPVILTTLPIENKDVHLVTQGEGMWDIAEQHGLNIKKLYFMNRMPYGSQPVNGEKLVLNKYLHFKKRPALREPSRQRVSAEGEYLFEEIITLTSE